MNAAKLYFRLIGVSLLKQIEYRLSFFLQLFGHFLITVIDFIAMWTLFDRFGSLQGWILAEVMIFYAIINISFALSDALTRGLDLLPNLIRSGDFDRYLLRPRSLLLQILGFEFTLKRIGRMAQALVILFWGMSLLGLAWPLVNSFVLLWIIVSSMALFFGLALIQASLSFWTVEGLETMNIFSYGGVAAAQYPFTIYTQWFRRFFTFIVPLACINYFPVLFILGKTDPLGSSPAFQVLAPLAAWIFMLLSFKVWGVGLAHYASTGS